MTSHLPPTSDKNPENACFDLVVAAALWVGAVCLICTVNYGLAHGVNVHLHGPFVLMHRYYGEWLVAGLAVLVGGGMCLSALRRMRSAPKEPPFMQGTVYLESAQWLRHGPPKSSAKATTSL